MKKQLLKANLKLPFQIEVDTSELDITCIVKEAIEKELALHGRTSIVKQFTTDDENVTVPIPKATFPMVGLWAAASGKYSFQTAPAIIEQGTETNNLIFNNAKEIDGYLILLF